jgi:hypothetical protein
VGILLFIAITLPSLGSQYEAQASINWRRASSEVDRQGITPSMASRRVGTKPERIARESPRNKGARSYCSIEPVAVLADFGLCDFG